MNKTKIEKEKKPRGALPSANPYFMIFIIDPAWYWV